jgi:hypothetical protein
MPRLSAGRHHRVRLRPGTDVTRGPRARCGEGRSRASGCGALAPRTPPGIGCRGSAHHRERVWPSPFRSARNIDRVEHERCCCAPDVVRAGTPGLRPPAGFDRSGAMAWRRPSNAFGRRPDAPALNSECSRHRARVRGPTSPPNPPEPRVRPPGVHPFPVRSDSGQGHAAVRCQLTADSTGHIRTVHWPVVVSIRVDWSAAVDPQVTCGSGRPSSERP